MQTAISPKFSKSSIGIEADAILRKCVHCGFCNATCPTYQLLGDELDGPRGRIYLMKQLFEGEQVTNEINLHLDRCLSCRNCETTCPSGVEYSKLLELGRETLAVSHRRGFIQSRSRALIAGILRHQVLFKTLIKIASPFRSILPKILRNKIPKESKQTLTWPDNEHPRKMIVLAGCVQGFLAPDTNIAAARVLSEYGISLIEIAGAGCCGAVDLHTTDEHQARKVARKLIDIWVPYLDMAEAFIMTASGCGVTVKEYPHLFRHEPGYLEKAKNIAAKTFDLCEILEQELEEIPNSKYQGKQIAFHAPCTLQHGQKLGGRVENILTKVGYELAPVKDSHLCCGSAGTYALFQPDISAKLKRNKLTALYKHNPDVVCTANIGCQLHLSVDGQEVKHWIELLL